jgi:hypothetical protein
LSRRCAAPSAFVRKLLLCPPELRGRVRLRKFTRHLRRPRREILMLRGCAETVSYSIT